MQKTVTTMYIEQYQLKSLTFLKNVNLPHFIKLKDYQVALKNQQMQLESRKIVQCQKNC